ncbi:MAG: Crp/Fnr family transcriptional regulator [Chloroflexi bacterium]|nr:Crp/Fnr family transcriptional regulator [Ardenticatenaceae bacterium]MBL1131634.1 Crp/Fnr family transcriptional regulator [Chloroflexota bacterium]NOG37751.1 Crp/Fnr family transcriptional regulator [Chloroflexota bacterium]GIK55033.1 MAG: Crp/Fnr family transcriptional regulator [Chloroflexota bacterium]
MNNFSVHAMLQQMPYFAHVAEPALSELAQQAVHRTFAANEMILGEGEPSAGLWIVENGRVKAYKLSPDGQEYILRFFGPGDTFNDLAALDDAPNAASATAVTAVSAWVIPTSVLTAALQADHQLALAVLQGVVGRVRDLIGRVEDLALRPVTARLARFLLEQVENPALAHPAITRALIANHLATTPESISRSLRVLEKAGAIRFDRHRIIITQPDILRQQAQL